MTQRSPRTGIPPAIRKPPIAEELKRLRELPPRTTNREALSGLERLAILNGIRDGLSPSRIATQWSMSSKTVQRFKSWIYDEPLRIFHFHVVSHRGKGMFQCVFFGETKSRLSQCQRHVLAHFFAHHIAQNIDLGDIPEVF